jgi:Protein of unknown function (DUF3140)
MSTADVSDYLWQEFNRAVNMTPAELEAWLHAEGVGSSQVATEGTQRVLEILSKPRPELTPEDAAVMESVIGRIRLEHRDDLRPAAGDDAWRHRLMALGHDPDKGPKEA